MYAVGATRAECVAVRYRLLLQHSGEAVHALQQQVRRISQLQAGGRVPNVGGGQPEVDVASFLAECLCHRSKKRCHVVVGDSNVFVDLRDIEAGIAPNLRRRFPGHLPEFGPRFHCRHLDIQPSLELILVTPDSRHFGARITWDHDDIVSAALVSEQGTRTLSACHPTFTVSPA